jgi:hypothetical protein
MGPTKIQQSTISGFNCKACGAPASNLRRCGRCGANFPEQPGLSEGDLHVLRLQAQQRVYVIVAAIVVALIATSFLFAFQVLPLIARYALVFLGIPLVIAAFAGMLATDFIAVRHTKPELKNLSEAFSYWLRHERPSWLVLKPIACLIPLYAKEILVPHYYAVLGFALGELFVAVFVLPRLMLVYAS